MAYRSANTSNEEQVTIRKWRIDGDLQVHERLIRLNAVVRCNTEQIVNVIRGETDHSNQSLILNTFYFFMVKLIKDFVILISAIKHLGRMWSVIAPGT